MKLITVLLTLKCYFQSFESHCQDYMTCVACTQNRIWRKEQCLWCPLTNVCNPKLSVEDDLHIRNSEQCVIYGKTKHYSPAVALRLAEFAAISYSDVPRQCTARIFPKDDYAIEKIILKACDDYYYDYEKKCSAIIEKSDSHREIIVAIRGSTELEQVLDQILVVMPFCTVAFPTGGKVYQYFMNVNNKLYPEIKATLYDLLKTHPGYEVKVTGHSLGGTVASLTSALLIHDKIVKPDQLLLYTFGMPRVGDKVFALNHDRIVRYSWRVVRDGDLVTEFPPCLFGKCSSAKMPYHHGTKVLYTGSKMNMNSYYTICERHEDCKPKSRRKRGSFISKLVNKHVEYFGIRIGQYCEN